MEITIIILISLVLIATSFKFYQERRLLSFFFCSFSIIYLCLRPVLVYFGLFYDFRPLDFHAEDPPVYFWTSALIIGLSALFSVFLIRKMFRKEEKIFEEWRVRQESLPAKLAFILTALLAVASISYAGFYFCMAYLLSFRTKLITTVCAGSFVTYFMATTDDRRHLVGFVIFVTLWIVLRGTPYKRYGRKALHSVASVAILLAVICSMVVVGALSIYYRNPDNVSHLFIPGMASRIIEVQLDFPIVYDDLNYLTGAQAADPLGVDWPGLVVLKPLVTPIPRSIWPDKPETSSREFAKIHNLSFYRQGGSLPTTLVGDAIFSFGILWMFGLALMVITIRGFVRFSKFQNLSMSMLTMLSFFLVRGPFDGFLLAFSLLLIFNIFYALSHTLLNTRHR